MKYLSVCSGIEAASVAWKPLGWQALAFSEIDPFPSAVLAHRWPTVPNWGDMNRYEEWPDAVVDVLVGGTPCQTFSRAGLRAGLDDPRGNLMLVFGAIALRYQPRWLVWENVPGVLSSNGGRDFGSFLALLAHCGYGFAYRVLDAQHVRTRQHYRGLPQRRKRVFVVGHRGNWRRAAAVLLERSGGGRNPAPPVARNGVSWWNGDAVSQTLDAVLHKGQMLPEKNRFPVLALGERLCLAPTAMKKETVPAVAPTTASVIALDRLRMSGMSTVSAETELCGRAVLRRLTVTEAERLMGLPDNHTRIPWRGKPASECPDSLRFKAIGNSMAVNCMELLGERIDYVDTLLGGVEKM